MPSLLLTVQPSFLFPGSVSCRGSLVPGFPGGPNPAQRVASDAVGPLSLSHPLPVRTHPPLPTVGNPSPICFQPQILPHPSGQTVIGWERAAAQSRVLWTGWEPGRAWGAPGAGVRDCPERLSLRREPIETAAESGGLFPSLTQAEPPWFCAPAAEPSLRRAGGGPPDPPGLPLPGAPPGGAVAPAPPGPGVHQPVRCDKVAFTFLCLGSSARAGEGTAWGQHLLWSLCCVNSSNLRP